MASLPRQPKRIKKSQHSSKCWNVIIPSSSENIFLTSICSNYSPSIIPIKKRPRYSLSSIRIKSLAVPFACILVTRPIYVFLEECTRLMPVFIPVLCQYGLPWPMHTNKVINISSSSMQDYLFKKSVIGISYWVSEENKSVPDVGFVSVGDGWTGYLFGCINNTITPNSTYQNLHFRKSFSAK